MRISSAQTWAASLQNLTAAQQRQIEANTQYSTQRVSTDLKGFGSISGTINAYQSTLSSTNAFIEINKLVSNRLETQNLALTTTSDAADAARQAVLDSIANDDGTNLLQNLELDLDQAINGLNIKHNGAYLFAGGNDQSAPLSATSLADLAAAPTVASLFTNGEIKKTSRVDNFTSVETGFLASDVGTKLITAFRDIKNYSDANGGFTKPLSAAAKTALTTFATQFQDAYSTVVDAAASNGGLQTQVESVQTALTNQSTTLQGLISGHTDVDLGEAYTAVQQAQTAVQASAQVISSLNANSLLNYLR
jgi:flagellar hook-associated protein 3 FlgL